MFNTWVRPDQRLRLVHSDGTEIVLYPGKDRQGNTQTLKVVIDAPLAVRIVKEEATAPRPEEVL